MSSRFWIAGTGTMVAAACAGLLLGGYATTPPRSMLDSDVSHEAALADEDMAALTVAEVSRDTGASMAPVGPVTCKGCGPTLADRRFAADMAGLDMDGYVTGTTDAIVRDYLADEPPPVDVQEPAKARPAAMSVSPPAVVRIARGGPGTKAPAPQVDAGMALAAVQVSTAQAATVQVATGN